MSIAMKPIFENIRAELKRRKWSVDSFCGKLGIRRNRFYCWEKANDLPVSYLIRAAELLEKSVDELINK
jgi:transcriptional regulator with XRE-family HTH domain